MKNLTASKSIFSFIIILFLFSGPSAILSQRADINITQNSGPQYRPKVAISHKDPNKAVCVWRDYRIGPVRTGYSYSTNGGITWSVPALLDSTLVGGGYFTSTNPEVCVDTAGNFYIAVEARNDVDSRVAVYKSTNGGLTFPVAVLIPGSSKNNNRPHALICDLSASSSFKNTLYAGWESSTGGHLLSKSTNGGTIWSTPVSTGQSVYGPNFAISPNGQLNQLSMQNRNALDVYYYNHSTDGGVTFSANNPIDSGYTLAAYFTLFYPSIACDNSGGFRNGYIYCVFSNGGTSGDVDAFLIRSTDNGNSWSPRVRITTDSINGHVFHHKPTIAVNNSGAIAINYYDFRNSPLPPPLPYSRFCEAWLSSSNDGGVTFSNNLLSSSLSLRRAADRSDIGIDYWGNKLIPVWTDQRDTINYEIFTSVTSLVGIEPVNNEIPSKFKLYQNYPNPFNPSAAIKFDLPKESLVKLRIFDILGRESAVLVNQNLKAGSYSVDWNASMFSSGIYFYRIETAEYTETKKMVLVK